MKNLTYLGMCWAMMFGLVAVALAQQPGAPGAPPAAPAGQDVFGQPGAPAPQAGLSDTQQSQNATTPGIDLGQHRAMPAPATAHERSMLGDNRQQAGQMAIANGQKRGELGVWMVETEGPGVTIQRITRGSAAEQAGLRQGDVILQVNGRQFDSPQAAAQMIRQIPIGQAGTLTIWRDGNQQQLQVTMQAARQKSGEMGREMSRDPYQVGFRGDEASASGDLAARTMKLEQQLATLTQELQQMRQEIVQLRAAHGNGLNSELPKEAPPASLTPPASITPPPVAAPPTAPPPGFGKTEEKPAPPASDAAKAAPDASKVAPPPTEKPATGDLFDSKPAQPKTDEKPKAGAESKSSTDSSDLFSK